MFPIYGKRRWREVSVEFGLLERATDSPKLAQFQVT
jgi:hypothetical protein